MFKGRCFPFSAQARMETMVKMVIINRRSRVVSSLCQAVERLIHPTLCEQCIEFLERRLVQQLNSSVERAGEEVLHAFILVHTKLLAFYSRYGKTLHSYSITCHYFLFITSKSASRWSSTHSSRNASTLSTSDLLALIIMAQNMYPSNVDLDDPSPEVENAESRSHSTTTQCVSPCFCCVGSCFMLCVCLWRMLRVLLALVLKVFTPQSRPLLTETQAVQVGCVFVFFTASTYYAQKRTDIHDTWNEHFYAYAFMPLPVCQPILIYTCMHSHRWVWIYTTVSTRQFVHGSRDKPPAKASSPF